MWSYKDIDLIEGCRFFLCKLSLIHDVLLTKLITHCNTYMYCFFFALLFRVGGGEGGGGNGLAHWNGNVFLQKK